MTERVRIGQLVRPSGSIITEGLSPETDGPTFGHGDWQDLFTIQGPVYGRWRYSDENEWRVTYYWPNGPDALPAFADHTGEGRFHSMNPDDPTMERDETAGRLRRRNRDPQED